VADFIQGRASKSISANHYLAKSQQAGFWYAKTISHFQKVFSNIKPTKNLQANSRDTEIAVPSQNRDYSEVEK
jgi:hypothetical protein